ncbi:hypothetical protein ZIOFF_050432 [Zingiber officinale]|uniref:RRM domain-containing protein n=1 Tax=Zingiber officinale TaxID=94328 RepID=A0A8J5FIV6_ZINOF|nr:hypothetical protein ZIOFF_050432 [Zingiber officinale]
MAEKDDTESQCPACCTPYDKDRVLTVAAANSERIITEVYSEKKQRSQRAKPKISEEVRKHLSGVKSNAQNLVSVVGLPGNLCDENILERNEYFGQYGKVLKASISCPAGTTSQKTFAGYITYAKEEEAVRCIQATHNYVLEGKTLRACFGTTKYCCAWLSNLFTTTDWKCVLPPPVDNSSSNGTKHPVKGANNVFIQSAPSQVKGSLPNSSLRKSNALPTSASWGLHGSNCRIDSSIQCSETLARQNVETSKRSTLPSALMKSPIQPQEKLDEVATTSKEPESNMAGEVSGSSEQLQFVQPVASSRDEPTGWNNELQGQQLISAMNEMEDPLKDQDNHSLHSLNSPDNNTIHLSATSLCNGFVNKRTSGVESSVDIDRSVEMANGSFGGKDSYVHNGHPIVDISTNSLSRNDSGSPEFNCNKERMHPLGSNAITNIVNDVYVDKMGESSIISDILSLEFDPWGKSVPLANSLANMLGETDKQDGSFSLSSSSRSPTNNQSRFSYAWQENQSSLPETTVRESIHARRFCFSSQNSCRDSFHNGLQFNDSKGPCIITISGDSSNRSNGKSSLVCFSFQICEIFDTISNTVFVLKFLLTSHIVLSGFMVNHMPPIFMTVFCWPRLLCHQDSQLLAERLLQCFFLKPDLTKPMTLPTQLSFQQPWNPLNSNNLWDAWNSMCTEADVGRGEIYRNDRNELNGYYKSTALNNFCMTSAGDLYSQAFGM